MSQKGVCTIAKRAFGLSILLNPFVWVSIIRRSQIVLYLVLMDNRICLSQHAPISAMTTVRKLVSGLVWYILLNLGEYAQCWDAKIWRQQLFHNCISSIKYCFPESRPLGTTATHRDKTLQFIVGDSIASVPSQWELINSGLSWNGLYKPLYECSTAVLVPGKPAPVLHRLDINMQKTQYGRVLIGWKELYCSKMEGCS